MISDLKNKLKMSDKQIKDITGGSKLGLEDFYSQMKTSGAFEPPKKKKTGGVENNNKIVRASDNNPIKRFVKKHFGTTYLQEMTDKELQAVADKPDSVFGKLKRLGQVAGERDRRLINLDKSYKDKVIRDHSKMLKELERRKKPRKKMGGTMTKKMNMGGVMKNRGGTFKGNF